MADFTAPSAEVLAEILACLETGLAAGRTIYLHCRGGRGRTGSVVGCYLVDRGRTGADALAALPYAPETEAQRTLVRRRVLHLLPNV